MRRGVRAVAVLVAVLVLGALAAAATATAKGPPGFFGLVPQDETPSSADIQRMGRGKVGGVRLLINWARVERSDDSFDFSEIDDYIGDLAAEGIRPLPFVWGVPPFISNSPIQMPVRNNSDKEQWKELLTEVVGRYGPGGEYWTTVYPTEHPGEQPLPVGTWQIWNEENGEKHATNPNPAQYAELVKISHAAITAVDANAEIVLGGMVEAKSNRGERIPASKFLKKMYKTAGVENFFDSVAIHPYSPDIEGLEDQFEKVRKVLKKNDRSAGISVTEMGWGSSKKGKLGVGKKQQAKLLKQSFKLLLKKRGKWKVDEVLWYTFRDSGDAPCDWCRTAGLFKANGTKAKPAWKQYVKFTGGS